MNTEIVLPLWIVILLSAGCAYALFFSILIPGVQRILRGRLNRVIDELNTRLKINIRPFQHTKKQVLVDRLVYDSQVIASIEQVAEKSHMSRRMIQSEAVIYAKEIIPAFNAYIYYRVGYWLARKILRFLYRVKVSVADREKLQAVSPDATIVFVMNHRSNMDYVLVSYLLAEEVIISYAVGEWAKVFPLQSLIKAMGAFFVRRNSNNTLYRKVLERYVAMATHEGVCQAVFPEGGLSRDGKIKPPKLGFIDYILRDYEPDRDREVVFVPVAINYDRVLEDINMLSWDKRENKKISGTLLKTINFFRDNIFIGARQRWKRYGYASVNFGIPLSIKQYCSDNKISFSSMSRDDRFESVSELMDKVMFSVCHVMPVLPVPLLSAVFLQSTAKTLAVRDVVAGCDKMVDRIIAAGAAMTSEQRPRPSTLVDALQMMKKRKMLLQDDAGYCINDSCRDLVRYYANSLEHWLTGQVEAGHQNLSTVSPV